MLKAVFFDLDGTLLPIKEDEFAKVYLNELYNYLKDYGYDNKDILFHAVIEGLKQMYFNDGSKSNKDVFFSVFNDVYKRDCSKDEEIFHQFYLTNYKKLKNICEENKYAKEIIDYLNSINIDCFLTTNPVFPRVGTVTRAGFINLKEDDFKYITSYENSSFCKPNPMYIKAILDKFNLKSSEVIVIGNNDYEDGECSLALGIKCYLIKGEYFIHNEHSKHQFEQIEMSDVIETINKEIELRKND